MSSETKLNGESYAKMGEFHIVQDGNSILIKKVVHGEQEPILVEAKDEFIIKLS